ncbi:hypothetical protein BD0086_10750 [Helicobacter pylori]
MGFCDPEIGSYALAIVSPIEKLMLSAANTKLAKTICKKTDAHTPKNSSHKHAMIKLSGV